MNVGSKDLTDLLEVLRRECETAINWFKKHIMIVNPDTCQSMIDLYLKKDQERPKQICIKYERRRINH